MAGREPLPSSDWPDLNRRPPGPEPGALAYCATIRSRRGGWFGIHPAGARFRSCRAATLPSAEGRTYAKPPSAPRRGSPEPHGTLRRLGSVAEPVWTWRGSNPLPSRCERDALPVELQALMASPRSHSPPGGRALSNPPPRGAGAFGVRVRSLGAIDEPRRGAGGSRTRVWEQCSDGFYTLSRRRTFASASPATACGGAVPGSYPTGFGRRLKCPPRFTAATGMGWLTRPIRSSWPGRPPCAVRR